MITISDDAVAYLRAKHAVNLPSGGNGLFIEDGSQLVLESNLQVAHGGTIKCAAKFGAFSYIHSKVDGLKEFGRYCSIGPNVTFNASRHPLNRFTTSPFTYDQTGYFGFITQDWECEAFDRKGDFVTIGNDVWIGEGALIMPGVSVGDGAVVGARAVVTRSIAPYHIVAGVPAKTVKMRFSEQVIERLNELNFWQYAPSELKKCGATQVDLFVEKLTELVIRNEMQKYVPPNIVISEKAG